MNKLRMKRMLSQIAFFFVVTVGLYGCSRDGSIVSDPEADAGGQQKVQAMGRYAESDIALPEGVTLDSISSFQNGPKGELILFTQKELDGKTEYTAYLLSENMTWTTKECGWLNQLELPYKKNGLSITFGEDQKLYAVYSEAEDDQARIPRHHIVRTEDWEQAEELKIPMLEETGEFGYTYYPRRIAVLGNGNLLFDSGSSIFLYDVERQQEIVELPNEDSYYFANNNQFYIVDGGSQSLIRYDGEDGIEQARIPLELNEYYGVQAIADDEGDVSLVAIDGIQILKDGSGIWEQIIEGRQTSMGSPKFYVEGFAKGSQEDYFVLYGSMDETCKLSRYVYDPELPVEPETELTIFSLRDNNTIRQAVSEFQVANPNVKIDFQPVLNGENSAGAEDYIRTLNTEILAGNGPDILILDGMSEASYIEKGILEDVTDEIEALVSSGDYLENIANGSRMDGRIYAVPVKIGLPLTFGRKEVLKEADQLGSLAGLVSKHEAGQVLGTVDRDVFLSLYADAYVSDIVSENGVVQEQELVDFLSGMKQIFDGSRISDGTREVRSTSIWGLLEDDVYLNSGEIAGFFQSGEGASVIEQAKGELEADVIAINETYIPYGTIGINKAGKHKALAVQFLKTALSEEVQRSDYYDGFSVNENTLEFLCGIERTSANGYGGSILGSDGQQYELTVGWPSEPIRRKLTEFCRTASHSAGRNRNIKQILLEYSGGYFDGTASLEETVGGLMTKMTLYLQE